SIQDLVEYRLKHESLIEEIASAKMPIDPYGDFRIKIFDNHMDNLQHIALIHGNINFKEPVLVRIHSECLTGDTFGSSRCDCGWQLDASIKAIAEQNGIILYLRQEGRGIGLANKIMAYALQDKGMDTVEANQQLGFKADHRDYTIGAKILSYLGVKKVFLLTNNPDKIFAVNASGIEIVERLPLEMSPTDRNLNYLQTKRDKLGHLLSNLK
ncbi:MAG: GTP cyclohydrolase II, partial [Legionella sp.]